MVGAHFGLTPTKYQSGETDVTGRISKAGDHGVRVALYEAANVILTRPVKGSSLKSWALGVAKRAGMKKAKGAQTRRGSPPVAQDRPALLPGGAAGGCSSMKESDPRT
jgi:transposase